MENEPAKKFATLRQICVALSVLLMVWGAVGMVVSFLFLASTVVEDIIAGASGFVAASIFIGSGLVSLAILSPKSKDSNS